MPGPLGTGGGGGGTSVTQVAFAETIAAPNGTVFVDSITAVGGIPASGGVSTNADLVLRPKGTGALLAQIPDNAVLGGNKRGAGAVDWQSVRTANTMVASGAASTISGGEKNTASGSTYATVGGGSSNSATGDISTVGGGILCLASGQYSNVGAGYNNWASGASASVGGGNSNTASGAYATVPGGYLATAELAGKLAYASGQFAASGDAQFGLTVCRATTTTNAAVNLVNDGTGTFSATNHLVLPNSRVYRFTIDIVASSGTIGTASTSTYGSFGGVWTITGAIRRATGVATTALIGTPTVLAAAVDSVLAAVSFTVLAEATTYGSLQIVATGLSLTQIHWVATIMTTEVG